MSCPASLVRRCTYLYISGTRAQALTNYGYEWAGGRGEGGKKDGGAERQEGGSEEAERRRGRDGCKSMPNQRDVLKK